MHRVEAGARPGEAQLSEVVKSRMLVEGATKLDHHAEEQLLRPLFEGAPEEFDRWRQEDVQGYIQQMEAWEQVRGFGGRGCGRHSSGSAYLLGATCL